VLGTLADIGYGLAWRILDSRFFGVPQRRRRVFIVGARADGDPARAAERAGEILAVGEGCDRHLAPSGEAGQDSPVASLSGLGSGGPDDNDGQQGRLVAGTLGTRVRHAPGDGETLLEVAYSLRRDPGGTGQGHNTTYVAGPLDTRHTPQGHGMAGVNDQAVANNHVVAAPLSHGSNPNSNAAGRRREDDENLIAGPLGGGNDGIGRRSEDDPNLVSAFAWQQGDDSKHGKDGRGRSWITRAGDYTGALSKTRHDAIAGEAQGVRRLTPTECERLQALPDGWTQLGDTPDSRRYAALGDAVTAAVAEWIGRRILNAGQTEAEVVFPTQEKDKSN
jgi:DNA (cytosine-5)-methyltransferase 1